MLYYHIKKSIILSINYNLLYHKLLLIKQRGTCHARINWRTIGICIFRPHLLRKKYIVHTQTPIKLFNNLEILSTFPDNFIIIIIVYKYFKTSSIKIMMCIRIIISIFQYNFFIYQEDLDGCFCVN